MANLDPEDVLDILDDEPEDVEDCPDCGEDAPHCRCEWLQCTHCNGSGEGMYDGSSCSSCGGSGEVPTWL